MIFDCTDIIPLLTSCTWANSCIEMFCSRIVLVIFYLFCVCPAFSLSTLNVQVSTFTISHLFCYLPDMCSLLIALLINLFFIMLQELSVGLPWWRSGWESACQCRGHRFEPWSGKIPHAVEQLGPWATITEPARLEPVLCNKRGHDSERPAHCDEEWPPLAATRESPHTEMKTQHTHK